MNAFTVLGAGIIAAVTICTPGLPPFTAPTPGSHHGHRVSHCQSGIHAADAHHAKVASAPQARTWCGRSAAGQATR